MNPPGIRINFLDNLLQDAKPSKQPALRYGRMYLLSFTILILAVSIIISGVLTSLKRLDAVQNELAEKEAEIMPILDFLDTQQKAQLRMETILDRLTLWEEDKYLLPALMQTLALSAPRDIGFEEIKVGTRSSTLLSGSTRSVFSVLELLARLEQNENIYMPKLETMWHKTNKVFFVLSFRAQAVSDGRS